MKTGPSGEVVVDQHLATHNPRIWAAGDVSGHQQYVYVAAAHGNLVADNAFNPRALRFGPWTMGRCRGSPSPPRPSPRSD